MTRWLENVPARLRELIVAIGLLDPERAAAGKPLREHLEDFKRSLSARDNSAKHIRRAANSVNRIFAGCKFKVWSDISGTRVEDFLSDLRDNEDDFGAQTFNSHLQAIKQFCRWMVTNRRATMSPLGHLKPLNVKVDKRHPRRALDPDEIRRLLEATRRAPGRYGMDGHERHLVYRLATETGLRANEVRTLTVGSFDLAKPTVTVTARDAKGKREKTLPLRPELAELLVEFFKNRMPAVKAFGGTYKRLTDKTAEMLKADLADAGIPYVDDAGRFCDFHSLRHSCGSLLAAAGVHPKLAQQIMRHSDINLTMSLYTHTTREQEADAVAKLPDLGAPSSQQQSQATGTDGKGLPDNSAICLAKQCRRPQTSKDNSGQPTGGNDTVTPVSGGQSGVVPPNSNIYSYFVGNEGTEHARLQA